MHLLEGDNCLLGVEKRFESFVVCWAGKCTKEIRITIQWIFDAAI